MWVVHVCAKHATTVLGWCGWLPRFCYAVVKVVVYLPKSKSPPPSLYSGPLNARPSRKETAHRSSACRMTSGLIHICRTNFGVWITCQNVIFRNVWAIEIEMVIASACTTNHKLLKIHSKLCRSYFLQENKYTVSKHKIFISQQAKVNNQAVLRPCMKRYRP